MAGILPIASVKLSSAVLLAMLADDRARRPHAVHQLSPIRSEQSLDMAFKQDAEFSNSDVCDLQTLLPWLSVGWLHQRKRIRFGPIVRRPSQTPTLAASDSNRLSERFSSVRRQRPAVRPRLGHGSRFAVTRVG